jgi:hypothetical protein
MTATPTPGLPENTGAVTSGTEVKATAATGGSLTGGLVAGTIIVWLVNRYTGLDLTAEQGAMIAGALGTTAAAAFGYLKRSRTSTVSEGFDRTLLSGGPPPRPRPTTRGHPYERGASAVLVVIAVAVVIIAAVLVFGRP